MSPSTDRLHDVQQETPPATASGLTTESESFKFAARPTWRMSGSSVPELALDPKPDPHIRNRRRPLSKAGRNSEGGFIVFERKSLKQQIIGCTRRSPITGEITVRPPMGFPNFFVVDLWTRPCLPTELDKLKADKYIFRPMPLAYRSWLYHQEFARVTVGGEDAMIRQCLSLACVDAPIRAGRWSPVAFLAPVFLVTGLTGDWAIVFPAIALVVILYAIAVQANCAAHYRFERLYSLAFRAGFLALVLTRLQVSGTLRLVGFVITLVACILDILSGDLSLIFSIRFHATYEILTALPERVFICRRFGAEELQAPEGKVAQVAEEVCGFAPWLRQHAIIADIGGMLVELLPMTEEDWRKAYEAFSSGVDALPYIGLDSLREEGDGEPVAKAPRIDDVFIEDF